MNNAILTNFSKDRNVNIMYAGAEIADANDIVYSLQTKQSKQEMKCTAVIVLILIGAL